jgi:3-oxoacyl-[acyl-carrier protein] reductase
MELNGKTAVVTGGATGMGKATALALAAKGARVVIMALPALEAEAKQVAAQCGDAAVSLGDVTEDADCRAAAALAESRFGRLDALVNNAGVTKFVAHADMEALSPEDFHRIYDVNVVGGFLMTRAALPAMRRAGRGAVVNIASIAGVDGSGSSVAYSASKGAVVTMTRSLARALAPEVRVNAICPGIVATEWIARGRGQAFYEEFRGKVEKALPLRAVVPPEEVARTAVFLIEQEMTTGETLLVDAGQRLVTITV